MLTSDRIQRLLQTALSEFAPEWEAVDPCTELSVRDPDDWLSGSGTYGVTLRHRRTGALTVIGKRRGPHPHATYCRGISFRVLQAYDDRNTDPILRFFQEIGVAGGARARAAAPRMAAHAAPGRGSRPVASGPGRSASPAARPVASPSRPPLPPPPAAPPAAVDDRDDPAPAPASALERRGRSGRGSFKKFFTLRPAMLQRLVRTQSPRAGVEVSGRVFTGTSPVLDLTRVTPTLSVSGKAVRLELSFADGEGVIVFECSRVLRAEFAGQTGEKALASILAAYGVGQLL